MVVRVEGGRRLSLQRRGPCEDETRGAVSGGCGGVTRWRSGEAWAYIDFVAHREAEECLFWLDVVHLRLLGLALGVCLGCCGLVAVLIGRWGLRHSLRTYTALILAKSLPVLRLVTVTSQHKLPFPPSAPEHLIPRQPPLRPTPTPSRAHPPASLVLPPPPLHPRSRPRPRPRPRRKHVLRRVTQDAVLHEPAPRLLARGADGVAAGVGEGRGRGFLGG